MGLVAYSFQGIYQEIRSMTSTTGTLILERRHEEGAYLLRVENAAGSRISEKAASVFDEL